MRNNGFRMRSRAAAVRLTFFRVLEVLQHVPMLAPRLSSMKSYAGHCGRAALSLLVDGTVRSPYPGSLFRRGADAIRHAQVLGALGPDITIYGEAPGR